MSRRLVLLALTACGSSPAPTTTPGGAPAAPSGPPAGQLAVAITTVGGALHYTATGRGVDLAQLPTADWLALPLVGKTDVAVDVTVPITGGKRDWSRANGTLEVHCAPCQLGDDHAVIHTESRFAGDIPFGHLAIDSLDAAIAITDGHARVTTWTLASSEIKLVLAGEVTFAPAFEASAIEACVRFDVQPALKTRDERMDALLLATGAARAGDGLFNIRLTGRLGDMRRMAHVCDGSAPLAAVPVDPPAERPDLPPDTTPAESTDELQAAIDASIKQIDDITFEVDLALVAKALENPMAIARGARVVPAMKDGKAQGFKLYAIRPSSAFAKLGFANGDTLTAIDGHAVITPDDALAVYTSLRDRKAGSTIKVDIVRRGKAMTITYRLR